MRFKLHSTTKNNIYEHLDSVNSDKVNESYSDNCNTIDVHLKKKKKKRYGKKQMGHYLIMHIH